MNRICATVTVKILFDGSADSFVIDFAKPPVSFNFNGNLPSSVKSGSFTAVISGVTATVNYTVVLDGTTATVSLDAVPSAGVNDIALTLVF